MRKCFSLGAIFALGLFVFVGSMVDAEATADRPEPRMNPSMARMGPGLESSRGRTAPMGRDAARFGGYGGYPGKPPAPSDMLQRPPAANPPFPEQFALGLDYGRVKDWMGIENPGALYGEIGAKWVKFPGVPWSLIEPERGGGYRWWLLDSMVKNYQENGFSILAVLICDAPWAVEGGGKGSNYNGGRTASPPMDQYWSQYEAWVKAVVERYDGDGINDMPGLKAPILDWEIESGAQHNVFWVVKNKGDEAKEYGRLLRVAYEAAHAAHKDVRIVLSGINLGDLFDDGLKRDDLGLDALIAIRFADRPAMRDLYQTSLKFIREVLSYHQYYDAIEFHYNHDYRAAEATVDWLKQQLEKHGADKPIWAGDALIANTVYLDSRSARAVVPLGNAVFDALDNRGNPLHGAAWNWYMADQASSLCKKLVTAYSTGLVGIMAGNEADWPDWRSHGVYWVYAGFYGQGGQELLSAVKGRRPAFYTYQMMAPYLSGKGVEVKRIKDDERPDLYLYRVSRPNEDDFFIAWHENSLLEKQLKQLTDPVAFLHLELTAKPVSVDLSPYLGDGVSEMLKAKKLITLMKGANDPIVPEDEEVKTSEVVLSRTPVLLFPQ